MIYERGNRNRFLLSGGEHQQSNHISLTGWWFTQSGRFEILVKLEKMTTKIPKYWLIILKKKVHLLTTLHSSGATETNYCCILWLLRIVVSLLSTWEISSPTWNSVTFTSPASPSGHFGKHKSVLSQSAWLIKAFKKYTSRLFLLTYLVYRCMKTVCKGLLRFWGGSFRGLWQHLLLTYCSF